MTMKTKIESCPWRVARFWVHTKRGMVKLALRPGQSVSHSENYSFVSAGEWIATETTWVHDGQRVNRTILEFSADRPAAPHDISIEVSYIMCDMQHTATGILPHWRGKPNAARIADDWA